MEINEFLTEQNTNVYLPSGVHLTDPIQRGLRVVRCHYFKFFNITSLFDKIAISGEISFGFITVLLRNRTYLVIKVNVK